MIAEAFLICALMLPGGSFNHPSIVSYHAARSEQDRLTDWLRKNNPDAEVFIHPHPQGDRLRKNGWEKVPFTWRGNEIWIQKKPRSDQKKMQAVMQTAA